MSDAPVDLLVTDLCRRCRDETDRYRRGAPHDDRICFEVFRRAIVERDERCWRELQGIYGGQVIIWCRKAGGASGVENDELAHLVWEKFWRSYAPHKLSAAASTASILRYLQMCAQSVATDIARRQAGPTVSLERIGGELLDRGQTPDEVQADRAARDSFWNLISEHLRGDRERAVIALGFKLGLKSAEIQAQRPDLFGDVRDVYRTTRNVLDRLARSPDLRVWLEQEGL
jgi:hypothetical protein